MVRVKSFPKKEESIAVSLLTIMALTAVILAAGNIENLPSVATDKPVFSGNTGDLCCKMEE